MTSPRCPTSPPRSVPRPAPCPGCRVSRCTSPTTTSSDLQGRSVHVTKQVRQLDRVVIRFAGDSGDGMQRTGDRFTAETARLGNDISTLPNFPAEIRAPAGTLPGVSSFQVHFADYDILRSAGEVSPRDQAGPSTGSGCHPLRG